MGHTLILPHLPSQGIRKESRPSVIELEQRVKDLFEQDEITGEHKDATPLDYIRWAIEEIELNKEAN